MNTGKCRNCNATVLWAETVNGKKIPLDTVLVQVSEVAVPKGENPWTVFVPTDGGRVQSVRGRRVVSGVPAVNVADGYVSHFATCPSKVR